MTSQARPDSAATRTATGESALDLDGAGARVRISLARVCVIGVGLIGGSLARDLRRLDLCAEIVGCGRSRANLDRAVELGIVDRYSHDIRRAAEGADLVVVAVPLGAIEPVLGELGGYLDAGGIVTDAGSAKMSVIEAARRAFGHLPRNFVPGHPVAGTERSGVEAAVDGLYEHHRVILTPMAETCPEALERVRQLWLSVGASVVEMDPGHHDEVLAATSHLPHMLAYTLVDVLGRMQEHKEIFRYAAGGFRDFTRIASSDPQMWHDICIANSGALATVLEHFSTDLDRLLAAVRSGDGEYVKQLFTQSKALRDALTEREPAIAASAPTERRAPGEDR